MSWKNLFGLLGSEEEEKEEDQQEKDDEELDEESDEYTFKSKFESSDEEENRGLFRLYEEYIEIIHLDIGPRELNNLVMKISGGITLFIFAVSTIYAFVVRSFIDSYLYFALSSTFTSFTVTYILITLGLLLYFDLTVRRRTKEIEDNLPDFLQITSANISAGMPIDRALWFAVRPKFGALADEMERVAKRVMAGEELEDALRKFSTKYDSQVLKETVSLLIEGINSGGEMAELLNKVSENISENKIMRKEIKANVTTYAIFIGTASVVAAPLLLALSTQLLRVIQDITQGVDVNSTGGSFFSFDFSGDNVNVADFEIFSMIILGISAFFSAAIISSIRKGNIKDGFKLIPIFVVISLIIYWAGNTLFDNVMGSII